MRRLLCVLFAAMLLAGCSSVVIDPVDGAAGGGAGTGGSGSGGGGGDGGIGGTGGSGGVDDEGCPDDPQVFRERIWEPLFRPTCLACHNASGAARTTRFVLVGEDDPDWLDKNQRTFREVAFLEYDGTPLLLLKPTMLHPDGHGGGRLIDPGSDDYLAFERLVRWIRGELESCSLDPVTESCSDGGGPRMLRRLTHAEYRNTVRDLLGLGSERAQTLVPDGVVGGFDNNAGALQVGDLLADQYRTVAEELAEAAVATRLNVLIPCHATGDGGCAASFIHDFGKRAFRRPLTEAEQQRYAGIFVAAADAGGSLRDGVQWVIAAMLQSPHFLYRSELGRRGGDGAFALDPWEVASELSYLFLQTMPDDELFAAAESGALLEPGGVGAQAERLAADPRADATMVRFVESWLHLDRLVNVPRDAATYPDLTPAIRAAMRGEIARLVEESVRAGASLADLLSADHTYVTDALAAYYGIDPGTGEADAEGFRRVELAGTPYGGLLRTGGLLTTHALPNSSSPIHRGKLIRERFLCQEMPPPPSNLNTSPPPMDPSRSTRERYAQHSSDDACFGCHQLIDPIGFAFEHFDGAGRYREDDGGHPVDDSGEILHSTKTDGTFHGVAELSQKLAASEEVRSCTARMWTAWATGLENGALACALDRQLGENGSLSGARLALAESTSFRLRHGGAAEGDAPGPLEDPGPVAIEWQPPQQSGVTLDLQETSRWASGACFDGTAVNHDPVAVTWRIAAELEGTVDNIWNAAAERGDGDTWWFSGAEWNAVLQPGGTASFGFCTSY